MSQPNPRRRRSACAAQAHRCSGRSRGRGDGLTTTHIAELLIAILGVAMGLQNAAAKRIGVPDLTTTVITMTLTGFAADSKAAGGEGARPGRKLAAIAAMLVGATIGALLQLHVAMWAALTLALVIILGVLSRANGPRRRRPAAP